MDVGLKVVRQMASYITVPIFLMDADETLIYYNEAGKCSWAVPSLRQTK